MIFWVAFYDVVFRFCSIIIKTVFLLVYPGVESCGTKYVFWMKPLVLLALNCGWVVHAAVIGLITGIEQCAPDAVGIGACDTLLSLQSNVTRAAARLFSSAALQVGVSVPASWSTVVHRGRSLAEHLMLAADHVMITDQAEVTCGPTTLLG